MKYMVGVTINNCFEVEADSVEDAEMQVREMDLYDTFADCDYNITYTDEIRDIPREMCNDLLRTMDGRVICDDEHGNTL